MSDILSDIETYGGWVTKRPSSTGSAFKRLMYSVVGATAVVTGTLAMLNGSGTGVVLPLEYLQRQDYLNSQYGQLSSHMRSAHENIIHIRKVLSPAISDLALALGVSRQSIYNWLNGEQIAEENIAKLQDIAKAADHIAEVGISKSMILHRKLKNGKTFFKLIQDGESPYAIATLLTQIHQHEISQQNRVITRFSNRKHTPATADFDLITPNDL